MFHAWRRISNVENSEGSPPLPSSSENARHAKLLTQLVNDGAIEPSAANAIRDQFSHGRLEDFLCAHGYASAQIVAKALSQIYLAELIDLKRSPPDIRLIDQLGEDYCIRHALVPVQRSGDHVIIACARPDELAERKNDFPSDWRVIHIAISTQKQIETMVVFKRRTALSIRAETRTPTKLSCRNWRPRTAIFTLITAASGLSFTLFHYPVETFGVLVLWSLITLCLSIGLKFLTLMRFLSIPEVFFRKITRSDPQTSPDHDLPIISIMVPLFKERHIAGHLVKRLQNLTYPKERLDICLVVEAGDSITHETLARSHLPPWMRQITVPHSSLKTKPRALNFALDFCRGDIIGVYDAEDAPEADQLEKVAQRFHHAPPNTACLQGKLDFYNPNNNWLSRCFTVEYSSWWRIILPGIEKLRLPVPLGGTTLFFRREALEKLGCWDAHNVTEDADLGIRLARAGYKTELIDTVTYEEANCKTISWLKQRSRWIKGYAMTYFIHMRQPISLMQELGLIKFLGFQLIFLGSLSQVLLAPVLWSFWVIPFGLPHPLTNSISPTALAIAGLIFFLSELISIIIGICAVNAGQKLWLRYWVPTLYFYFPLATIAGYKALVEVFVTPFYWSKTEHGVKRIKRAS